MNTDFYFIAGVCMYVNVHWKRVWAPMNIYFFMGGKEGARKIKYLKGRFLAKKHTPTYIHTPGKAESCNMGCFSMYVCILCM